MTFLDLSDNIILVPTARSLTIQDKRKSYQAQDAHYLFLSMPVADEQEEPGFAAVLAALRAGRVKPDGSTVEVRQVALDYPHRAYGRKVLEGTATYADGEKEEWRIQVDPMHMRFDWVRQPYNLTDQLFFRIVTPRPTSSYQLWHTGSGFQLGNGAIPQQVQPPQLSTVQETELLFYSVHPRNCFRMELTSGGRLEVLNARHPGRTLEHEEGWSSREAAGSEEPLWDVRWQCDNTALVRLSASWGVIAAARDFVGRAQVQSADASADFGPFFSQMVLGCLPLNLYFDAQGLLPRSSVLGGRGAEADPATLRELVFAAESLYLVSPDTTAEILAAVLSRARAKLDANSGAKGKIFADEDCPLLMIAAWRLHKLRGAEAQIPDFLPMLRASAQHVLALRRPNEAMPIVQETWGPQGVVQGKEPYFVALCHLGLRRLSELEQAFGDTLHARGWLEAARAMQFAAVSPYIDGGLWHHEHGVFINYQDFRDPGLATPHNQNWSRSLVQQQPVARVEYVHYETILPLWLGLLEDRESLEGVFEWIDGQYTYASGRGGATFPPCVHRNFVALLDVYLRQCHGQPGATRLLQLILDHAFDGGVPLTRAPFGTYAGGGPSSDQEDFGDFRSARSGQLWDNSPYFALVLHLHYGLDYSHEGWSIGTPLPLANYPLSRVTNLRHKHAVYSITWQGRGRVKRINVNGKNHHHSLLGETEGEHEVVIFLS